MGDGQAGGSSAVRAGQRGGMSILQVCHGFPPDQVGGTERYTAHVVRALQARGHRLWVVTRGADWHRPEYAVSEEEGQGVPVFRINNTWRAYSSFEDSYHHLAVARRVGELLDRLRPDVVHIQHLVHLSTHIPDEARQRGLPVVMTFHDYWLLCNQGQLLRDDGSICLEGAQGACTDCTGLWPGIGPQARRALHFLERCWPDIRYRTSRLRSVMRSSLRFMQRSPRQGAAMADRASRRRAEMRRVGSQVDVGIAPSQIVWDHVAAFGFPMDRLLLLPYGIPTQPLASERKRPSNMFRVAYFGRAIPAKGVHVLLEAARRLDPANIRIDIHGDVPPYGDVDGYAQRLRQQATRMPAVRWRGGYDHAALSGLLADTDVVVVPSIWYENEPLVILEAFASRTPVVATNLGGMRELVRDGENGLLFPRGDAEALAGCLTRLAGDPALLQRLRDGIGPVKDIETHAQEIERLYERLCSRQADKAGCAA